VIYQDADTNRSFTYSQVRSTSIEFGRGLKSIYDWKKGDVLALFSPNCVDTPSVTFGALWAGATVSPANPGYTVAELVYQLRDCGARAIVTQLAVIDTVRKACRQVGIGEDSIILIGDKRDPNGRVKHWTSIHNISGAARYRKTKISPKTDVAFLVYSSGTTGTPKGVMLSHYNISSNVQQIGVSEGGNLTWNGSKTVSGIPLPEKGHGDKILACLPFFHIYGLTILVHKPVYLGLTSIIMPRFEIENWCRLVQQHRITFSYIVPPIVVLLSKHPKVVDYDLSSIRMMNSGAAPLTRELIESVYKRTGIRIEQGYGLSETSPTTHQQRWEDWQSGMGSTGGMLPNMEMKFCAVPGAEGESDGTKELPKGETGELYVKGPNIFLGYHKKPEATAGCLTDDGWFRTGDVGHLNDRGDLYITDRVKELIKYKGFQVPPAELEGYLVDNEMVDDVAVVGVESEELGTEVPRAYIVRKGGMKAVQRGDEERIASWLAAKVANHKKLRGGVKFVDAVPKNATGKILRRILKEEARKEYKALEDGKLKAKL
jgi:4-coumarate--CoA ligase